MLLSFGRIVGLVFTKAQPSTGFKISLKKNKDTILSNQSHTNKISIENNKNKNIFFLVVRHFGEYNIDFSNTNAKNSKFFSLSKL